MGDGAVVLAIVLILLAIVIIAAIVTRNRDHASKPPAPVSPPPAHAAATPPAPAKATGGMPDVKKIYSYPADTGKAICRYCGAEKDNAANRCPVCGEK